MPIIPPQLPPAEQAFRLDYLAKVKQPRFKYCQSAPPPGMDGVGWSQVAPGIPCLDPALIPLIKAQQPDYWFDAEWIKRDKERREMALGAFFGPPNGYPNSIPAYGDLKMHYPAASSLGHKPKAFTNDASFAAQRLGGANPLLIQQITLNTFSDWETKLAITDRHIMRQVGTPLLTLAHQGRLFVCDYQIFLELNGDATEEVLLPPPTKYVTGPLALFYWKGDFDDGHLRPLGIQFIKFQSAEVFTPPSFLPLLTFEWNWRLAKAAVQVADALAHEWDSHLVRTHVALTPFAISSERHLHDDHPLLVLLRPHLRYLLAINSMTDELVGKGSYGDLLGPVFDDRVKLLGHYHANFNFATLSNPHKELASRFMDHASAPIQYPYRDDGLPVYDAIRSYVEAYLRLYYQDHEVSADQELQNFIVELSGKVAELTPNGDPVANVAQLADLIAGVLWLSGPQHAAVNFAQWGYMSDPLNMSFAGYLPPPEAAMAAPPNGGEVSFFPQYPQGKKQTALTYVLGTWRMDTLGHYRAGDFTDHNAFPVIADFQCRLAKIAGETFIRNSSRTFDYPYLMPGNIPNSTSI